MIILNHPGAFSLPSPDSNSFWTATAAACGVAVGLLDCRASGRLGCVGVLSDPDRMSILDPGYLDGGDVATCPSLLKVKAECVKVLSDPDRRNVLDPGYLDGGDVAMCPRLPKVNAAAKVIYDLVDPSANLIFGAVVDLSLSGQMLRNSKVSRILPCIAECAKDDRNVVLRARFTSM
ncbi:hypothetical protein AgCh_011859 [Apium graveolens]